MVLNIDPYPRRRTRRVRRDEPAGLVSDLTAILGRPESTPPQLVDEFLLIRISRPGAKR
jgi:hypothetical protein